MQKPEGLQGAFDRTVHLHPSRSRAVLLDTPAAPYRGKLTMSVPRILVIGDDGAVAALLRGRFIVASATIADVLRTAAPAADLVILYSAVPSRDVRALAGRAGAGAARRRSKAMIAERT